MQKTQMFSSQKMKNLIKCVRMQNTENDVSRIHSNKNCRTNFLPSDVNSIRPESLTIRHHKITTLISFCFKRTCQACSQVFRYMLSTWHLAQLIKYLPWFIRSECFRIDWACSLSILIIVKVREWITLIWFYINVKVNGI